MKIISLSILSIALSISLSARDNPFEPTDHFLTQKEQMIKKNKEKEIALEQTKDKEPQKLIVEDTKPRQLEITQTEPTKIKKQPIKALSPKPQVIEQKKISKQPYIPEVKETFNVLPFVNITIINDVLTIAVDKKYKLLNQDIIKPNKKLLFDFEGNVSFYTVRKEIISESFKSFAVGTHREKNFFRVVVDLPSEVIDYRETVDGKNGVITITKKGNK